MQTTDRAITRLAALAGRMGLMVLLAACQHYQAAPLEPRASAAAFAARRLDDPVLRGGLQELLHRDLPSWPLERWDRAQLLAVALLRNPDLAVGRAQLDLSLSQERVAAQKFTVLGLTLESEYARQETYPWLYGLALALPLPGPSHRLERQIAHRDAENARWQYLDQTWAVRQALADALNSWEVARRRLMLLDRLAAADDRLLALQRLRVQAGEDAPATLLAVETAHIELEHETAQARSDLNAAQGSAAKVLGVAPDAVEGLQLQWPEWGSPPPPTASAATREQALLSRSDLAMAIGDYGIAESRLALAIARQYPHVDLEPGYYWDHGIAKLPIDLGISLPLNARSEIAAARASRELAGQRMLALQADIYGQIAAAERAEHQADSTLRIAERALEAARRQAAADHLRVETGAAGMDQSITADIVALRAELALLDAQSNLQSARNHLEDVMHAPLSGPELALASAAIRPGAQSGS
jgi:outer membrane protein TolC